MARSRTESSRVLAGFRIAICGASENPRIFGTRAGLTVLPWLNGFLYFDYRFGPRLLGQERVAKAAGAKVGADSAAYLANARVLRVELKLFDGLCGEFLS